MDCGSQQWVLKAVIIAATHDDRYNCIHLNIFRTSDYLTSLQRQYHLVKNGTDSHSRENRNCIYIGLPIGKKKKKSLRFLYVFFPSLLVEVSCSFHICMFIFSHTPQIFKRVLLQSSQAPIAPQKEIYVCPKQMLYPQVFYCLDLNSQLLFPRTQQNCHLIQEKELVYYHRH